MIAAFTYWQLWQGWHWPLALAMVVVLFIEAPLMAIYVESQLMRRLHGASVQRTLMVSLGLLVILVGVATLFWGNPDVIRTVPPFFDTHHHRCSARCTCSGPTASPSDQQLLTVGVAVVVAVGLRIFFRTFRLGVAMRAVVDDPELVAMSGAKPYRISQMGWALGFILAAVAGVLIAPTQSSGLSIQQLTLLVINGYAAAVVGRLRSLPMTFLGAMLLGLVSEYAVGYLPGHINQNVVSVLPTLIPVVFLFVVLLVIPAARLAAAGRLPVHLPPRW